MSTHKLEVPNPAFDRRHFKVRHPEISPYVHLMLGVYTTCQPDAVEPVNLDEAYAHTTHQCAWCQRTLGEMIEQQKQYIQ